MESELQFIVWHLLKHLVFCLVLVTYNIVLFNLLARELFFF